MQDHELKVKHIESGKELIVSKAYYHNSPDEYEVLEGKAGKISDKGTFTPPAPPAPVAEKMDGAPTKNKAAKKATPVPPPSV